MLSEKVVRHECKQLIGHSLFSDASFISFAVNFMSHSWHLTMDAGSTFPGLDR